MAQRRRRYSAAEARRRKAIRGWFYIFLIVILLGGSVWLLASALSQIKTVQELKIDDSAYQVLAALPTQSEAEEQQHQEEMQIQNEIFEQKDTYPIEMVIQTPCFVMYDVQGKQVLYAKNADEKAYPASTTKILTAGLMMEYAPEDMTFTAGDEQDMVNPGSSLAVLNKGQSRLDLDMMLDAIMLPSGNDAAYCAAAAMGRIISENDSLSADAAVSAFVNKMNEKAEELGCTGSHFTCPDGFHDDDHYTTAMDLLRITLYSEQFPAIAASGKKTYRELSYLSGEQVAWNNSNKLIQPDSEYYYMYSTGLKTGMTDMSGYCVVATAERFGHELIIVSLGSESSDLRWREVIAMFDAGFAYIRNNDVG